MADRNLQELLDTVAEPRRAPAQCAGRAERLSRRAGGVHELARRAAGMAADVRAVQPDLPHGRAHGGGPGCAGAAHEPRGQQLRDLRAGQGQAVRPVHARRLRDRRRHPLRARRGSLQPRRPRAGAQLGHLPRRDRGGTTSRSSSTSARRCASDRRRRHYRFQVQGPNAMAVIEKALGHAPEELKFFNMRTEQIAGVDGHRAAPRHGRPAGLGALRAVRGRRGGARGARERRPGSRAHARGRARLRVQRDRVGLDPVAASGRLHGRGRSRPIASGCPRPATRARPRWAAASSRRTSRTTTSPRGTSATATSSSSTTTSSAARRSSGWRTASTAPR